MCESGSHGHTTLLSIRDFVWVSLRKFENSELVQQSIGMCDRLDFWRTETLRGQTRGYVCGIEHGVANDG